MRASAVALKNGCTLTLEDLPEENAQLTDLEVDFPSLPEDQTEKFRELEDDLADSIRREGEAVSPGDLKFLRSARLNESQYWIWAFMAPGGEKCYATVQIDGDSRICYLFDQDWDGLTPEQFLAADYFQCL